MSSFKPHRWLENEWKFPTQKLEENGRFWSLSGRADLIFETEEKFLILDLKTGGFKKDGDYLAKLNKEGELGIQKLVNNKDLLQMLLYNRMARTEPYFSGKPVRSVLFYLANPRAALVDPFEKLKEEEAETEFLNQLEEVIGHQLELLADPTAPILQTENEKQCEFCSFSPICQK